MEMCPKCNVEMEVGIAIGPTLPDHLKNAHIFGGRTPHINKHNIFLENVWKCKSCGHSKDIKE